MSRKIRSWNKSQRRKNARQRSRDAVARKMGTSAQPMMIERFELWETVMASLQYPTDDEYVEHERWRRHLYEPFDFSDGLYERHIPHTVNWKVEGF